MSERETALKAGDELIIREGNGIERRVRYIGVRDGRKRYAVRNTSTGRLSYIHPQDPRARCASSRTPLARIPAEPTHVVPLAICMEAQRCAAQNGRIDPDYLVGLYRRGAEARTVVDGNGEILTQAAVDRLLSERAGADPVPVCQWRDPGEDDSEWQTGCGKGWTFIDDGPVENGVKFCPYCGKPLATVPAEQTNKE